MKIIKEYCPSNNTVVIRSNCYGSQLDHIMNLFREAQEDFFYLRYEDVRVTHFAGEQYKHTFGIEFAPTNEVPDTYNLIESLEYTL